MSTLLQRIGVKLGLEFKHQKGLITELQNETTAMVSEQVVIPVGGLKTYDLLPQMVTLGGAEQFDFLAADVRVKIKNTDPTSDSFEMFVNSEAVITVGLNETTHTVNLFNYHTEPVDCFVWINIPTKKV